MSLYLFNYKIEVNSSFHIDPKKLLNIILVRNSKFKDFEELKNNFEEHKDYYLYTYAAEEDIIVPYGSTFETNDNIEELINDLELEYNKLYES